MTTNEQRPISQKVREAAEAYAIAFDKEVRAGLIWLADPHHGNQVATRSAQKRSR